ncbi:hypothetical protein JZ751_008766 [Albula glossodonta]|uniref:K Homology domain-containing protein n=1 Tax=Albula glossodonta TaxID=121402 RepID=A0A8T2P7M8_9TELE|nr:hypothetical protein JZ751_008766 [Albula glossodonta]
MTFSSEIRSYKHCRASVMSLRLACYAGLLRMPHGAFSYGTFTLGSLCIRARLHQHPCSHFSPVPQDLVDDRMPNHSPADPETNTTNDGLCDSGTRTEECEALATSAQCQTMSTMTEEQPDTVEENMMRPDSMPTSSRETTPEEDGELHIWETEVPKHLVGALIGKDGKYLKFIKQRCNGLVYMSTHPHYQDYMICNIMGTKQQVNEALKLIGEKIKDQDPKNIYSPPSVTFGIHMNETQAPCKGH